MSIPDERIDRHIRLVADKLDVPTVTISFVDAGGRWFKSGLSSGLSPTSQEESICFEAFRLGYVEIQDTFENVFFHDHPAARGERPVRFYAGAVLYGKADQPIGTIFLNDTVPRKLSAAERSWLNDVARLIENEINSDENETVRERDGE